MFQIRWFRLHSSYKIFLTHRLRSPNEGRHNQRYLKFLDWMCQMNMLRLWLKIWIWGVILVRALLITNPSFIVSPKLILCTPLYIVMALEPIETAVVAPLLSFRVHLRFNFCLSIQSNIWKSFFETSRLKQENSVLFQLHKTAKILKSNWIFPWANLTISQKELFNWLFANPFSNLIFHNKFCKTAS